MLEKFKQTSLVTKILYLLAIVLFLVWVIPSMVNYYSNVNEYEKSLQEIHVTATKYSLNDDAKPFTADGFKANTETLFSNVVVSSSGDNRHEVTIKMKREDIKKFHTFVETLSLRYLVKIEDALEFKANDDNIEAKMILVEL